jgi:hypothetical protein
MYTITTRSRAVHSEEYFFFSFSIRITQGNQQILLYLCIFFLNKSTEPVVVENNYVSHIKISHEVSK